MMRLSTNPVNATMLERAYRQRLEADLARWQADGVITPATGTAIRHSLPPLGTGLNIAVVVGIVGGLLIAAAFLAFVAASWTAIARPVRFAILLSGIAGAYGIGAWFAAANRAVLADLGVSVGTIVFGAAIALVGQMYHLGDDFAVGMLLWAAGALAVGALTESRGALAVALVAGCIWSGARAYDTFDVPHLPFVPFWLLGAALALVWNSRVAAHLVALAAIAWWVVTALRFDQADVGTLFMLADGAALLLGAGLALAHAPREWPRTFGSVLSAYGAFSLAVVAGLTVAMSNEFHSAGVTSPPPWATACGVAGAILAFIAGAIARRPGAVFAGGSASLALLAAVAWTGTEGELWLAYALELGAMLCLVVSGMLDAARPRIVAGWLGLAGVIAAITWAVKGSLLRRSVFLAVAGGAAVALAVLLDRLRPKVSEP
jgi:uncharacterized membrane protein